ncbi:MAG: VOC family protein [Chloroflexota bacterium]|nr:MAG: VOC family protein [Chloroflexota bacterium]
MAATDPTRRTATPPWRGFHHIALVTPDLDATMKFYTEVLGMHVTAVFPASDRNGRHCFIKPGETEAWGLHVFEQPDVQLFPYPADMQRFVFVPGALQHIAFALPSRADAEALRERLSAFGIPTTPINTIGPIQNMLFRDNNGILLEATWPAADDQ